jgi:hypothetical protein
MPRPPGSGSDEPPPAGTASRSAMRGHRMTSLYVSEIAALLFLSRPLSQSVSICSNKSGCYAAHFRAAHDHFEQKIRISLYLCRWINELRASRCCERSVSVVVISTSGSGRCCHGMIGTVLMALPRRPQFLPRSVALSTQAFGHLCWSIVERVLLQGRSRREKFMDKFGGEKFDPAKRGEGQKLSGVEEVVERHLDSRLARQAQSSASRSSSDISMPSCLCS